MMTTYHKWLLSFREGNMYKLKFNAKKIGYADIVSKIELKRMFKLDVI